MLEILLADRPPTIDINEVDPNVQAAVKRRLPPEVKQKLAKVARLSVCSTLAPQPNLLQIQVRILLCLNFENFVCRPDMHALAYAIFFSKVLAYMIYLNACLFSKIFWH